MVFFEDKRSHIVIAKPMFFLIKLYCLAILISRALLLTITFTMLKMTFHSQI